MDNKRYYFWIVCLLVIDIHAGLAEKCKFFVKGFTALSVGSLSVFRHKNYAYADEQKSMSLKDSVNNIRNYCEQKKIDISDELIITLCAFKKIEMMLEGNLEFFSSQICKHGLLIMITTTPHGLKHILITPWGSYYIPLKSLQPYISSAWVDIYLKRHYSYGYAVRYVCDMELPFPVLVDNQTRIVVPDCVMKSAEHFLQNVERSTSPRDVSSNESWREASLQRLLAAEAKQFGYIHLGDSGLVYRALEQNFGLWSQSVAKLTLVELQQLYYFCASHTKSVQLPLSAAQIVFGPDAGFLTSKHPFCKWFLHTQKEYVKGGEEKE